MFGKLRVFVLSNSTVDFKEVRFFKTKVLGSGLLCGMLTFGILVAVNHFSNDIFGLGYDRLSALNHENRVLKSQLTELSKKIESVQHSVGILNERGNDLRLLVDLPRIDDDIRSAAIGGSNSTSDFSLLSHETADLLAASNQLIDQLSREVKLQQESYKEMSNRYEFNKGLFAHVPAIKPMVGNYSVHGFGMRVHPVLRVYRMHEGIDIPGDVGTLVYATGDGTVRFAGRTQGGYGTVIEIAHGYGYSSLYAHLSKILVRPGQKVKRGDIIAKSGRSGLVSGPHLHYEVRHSGRKQNPVDFFFDDVDPTRYQTALAKAK